MDQFTIDALETLLIDIRNFRESDDGTDQYPDETYLVDDVESRIDALVSTPWELCSTCHRHRGNPQHGDLCK